MPSGAASAVAAEPGLVMAVCAKCPSGVFCCSHAGFRGYRRAIWLSRGVLFSSCLSNVGVGWRGGVMGATGFHARHVGIVVKHRAGCASEREERCNCRRVYQAAVWSARDAKRIRKHFDRLGDAKSWRAESYGRLRRRELRPRSAMTFGEAAVLWLAGVRAGSIRTRSGDVYKPSTIRSYEQALRGPKDGTGGLLRELGHLKLSELSLDDLQGYADRLLGAGAEPSTIRNQLMPVRVICRWRRREVQVTPTAGLALPAVRLGHNLSLIHIS